MAEIVICRKLEYICRIYIYGDLNGTMLDQCLSRGTTWRKDLSSSAMLLHVYLGRPGLAARLTASMSAALILSVSDASGRQSTGRMFCPGSYMAIVALHRELAAMNSSANRLLASSMMRSPMSVLENNRLAVVLCSKCFSKHGLYRRQVANMYCRLRRRSQNIAHWTTNVRLSKLLLHENILERSHR